MEHKRILSSAFNMSLGFIPVIIAILLCEFITQDTAIYIGTGIGVAGIYLSHKRKGVLLPNFILYIEEKIHQPFPAADRFLQQTPVCPRSGSRCRVGAYRPHIRHLAFHYHQRHDRLSNHNG